MTLSYTSRSDNTTHWVTVKAVPIFDHLHNVILAVNVMQDITQLKETERRLKEANDRITKLLEQAMRLER